MDTVEIRMDGFVETLEALRESQFDGTDSEYELLIGMVYDGSLDLSVGPLAVMRGFSSDYETISRSDYEDEYPDYAKIMTWDEFVRNECVYGNEEAAVLREE